MNLLNKFVDVKKENSKANKMRKKRFNLFLQLIKNHKKPLKIIDFGGTYNFWEKMQFPKDNEAIITLVNLKREEINDKRFKSLIGNVCSLKNIKDNSFNIVFSNSVIEHLYTFENQRKMANEVKRIGKRYFIQTPNRYFPLEPHYLFPLFQFLPKSLKIWMVMHFNLGWHKKAENREKAEEDISETRLLTKNELSYLFPEAKIYEEKFLWFTKSFIAYKA